MKFTLTHTQTQQKCFWLPEQKHRPKFYTKLSNNRPWRGCCELGKPLTYKWWKRTNLRGKDGEEKELKLPAAFRELRWYEIIYSSLQNVLLPPRESKLAELELLTLLSYKFFKMQLTKLLVVYVMFHVRAHAPKDSFYEVPQFMVTGH